MGEARAHIRMDDMYGYVPWKNSCCGRDPLRMPLTGHMGIRFSLHRCTEICKTSKKFPSLIWKLDFGIWNDIFRVSSLHVSSHIRGHPVIMYSVYR